VLEDLLYRRHYRVCIASTQNPMDQLQDSAASVDLDRWRRLFQSFRLETTAVGSQSDEKRIADMSARLRALTGVASSGLETLVLAECSLTPFLLSIGESLIAQVRGAVPLEQDMLFEIGIAAEPFYRTVWVGCSKDEKLVLRQLAEEGVVNPRNRGVVGHLLRSGLIRRGPTFRIMNQSFRR